MAATKGGLTNGVLVEKTRIATTAVFSPRYAVKSFLRTLAGVVFGVLSGFDRLMFRGHLRQLSYPGGMHCYCNFNGVKLTEFKAHAQRQTARLIEASQAQAQRLGRPIHYLASPQVRKEDLARQIAERDGVSDGLVAVFRCVEPCASFTLRGNGGTKKLEFRPEVRKCLHLYHYYQHPRFGFMYARVQTWAVHDPGRPQRPRVAGAAVGRGRAELPPPRQLRDLGRRRAAGAAAAGCAVAGAVAAVAGRGAGLGAAVSPGVAGQDAGGLLLVAQAVGVGQ